MHYTTLSQLFISLTIPHISSYTLLHHRHTTIQSTHISTNTHPSYFLTLPHLLPPLTSQGKYTNIVCRSQAVVERAFKGSSADQFNLATNYLEGSNGFHKSSERGVYWLTQAVNGGEVVALNQLGIGLYYYSYTFSSSLLPLLLFALIPNLASGLCYLEGNGAIKDEKLAYQMIKLGADKGDVTAMVNAAMLSTNGCGTSVDYRLGILLFCCFFLFVFFS